MGASGNIAALDILPMAPLPGVTVLRADCIDQEAPDTLYAASGGAPMDLVMSNLAPNISGESAVDQPGAMYLAELAVAFAGQVLRPGGDFVVKVFQIDIFGACLRLLRDQRRKVVVRKPRTFRPRGRNAYLLARHREL